MERRIENLKYDFIKYYILVIILRQLSLFMIDVYYSNYVLVTVNCLGTIIITTAYFLHLYFPYDYDRISKLSCIFFLVFDILYGAVSKDYVLYIFLNTLLFPWVFYMFFDLKKTIVFTLLTLLIFPLNYFYSYFFNNDVYNIFYENILFLVLVIFDMLLLFILLFYFTEINNCKAILKFINQEDENVSFEKAKDLFKQTLSQSGSNSSTNNSYTTMFMHIEDIMKSKEVWRNAEYSIEQLSNDLNLTVFQVSAAINYCTKNNYKSYINNYRLQAFENEIKNKKSNEILFKEIYLDLGFNSRVTFNRNFKNKFGKTPQEYVSQLV